MTVDYPGWLVAVDKTRDRVFVLEKPFLIAVKMDGQWYYGMEITDAEIDDYYDLVLDEKEAQVWLDEAKTALNLHTAQKTSPQISSSHHVIDISIQRNEGKKIISKHA